MSENKHTPGPWSIYFNSQDDIVIRKMFPSGDESHVVARCHSGAANARLIAAAPELLDALEAALKKLEENQVDFDAEYGMGQQLNEIEADGNLWPETLAARAAIASVKGGAA